jgi:hypothetical protein
LAVAAKTSTAQSFRDGLVDGQDAIAEPGSHVCKPSIEGFGLIRAPPPLQLDAATDFGEDNHARPDVLDLSASDPSGNVRMRSVAFAEFGNDIRVEQEFYRSILRQFHWRG